MFSVLLPVCGVTKIQYQLLAANSAGQMIKKTISASSVLKQGRGIFNKYRSEIAGSKYQKLIQECHKRGIHGDIKKK